MVREDTVVDTSELEARLATASTEPVDPVERVDALNALAWALRNRDVPRANALAKEARSLAQTHGYKLGQARAARTLAMASLDLRDIGTLFELAEEAKRLFDEVDDGPGRAASRDFLSSIHEFIGDLSGGLELALDALTIAREIGDPVRQGYALSSVGGLMAATGHPDEAIARLREALRLFQAEKNDQGVGTICSRLSRVLKDEGRTEEALEYAQMCAEAAEATGIAGARWSALTAMAELKDKRGNAAEAERLYRTALGCLATEIDRNVLGVQTQVALGSLLARAGSLAQSEIELKDALQRIPADSVSFGVVAEAHEALADLYEGQGRLALTVEHLRAAKALREQVNQEMARKKLARAEARAALETAKKDAEIDSLRRDVERARQLGQYTLERKLGEGGMGVVYRASHAMMRRPTAVKLLPLDKAGVDVARFEQEVRQTARLTHPNTITVFDYGRTPDGVFYYAMELLDGANTEAVVQITGPMPPERVIHVLLGITSALGEAHGIGLIHRDIKPANVFLCRQGGRPDVPKLLDFGLVKEVTSQAPVDLTHAGVVAGTPLFMAPERVSNPAVDDPRSDLYSVGALGYYLLTGEHVFEGANLVEVCGHHLHSVPIPPSGRLGRSVSADLEALILACLAKAPQQRPRDAATLVAKLEACEDNGGWTLRNAVEWWDEYGLALAYDDRSATTAGLRTIAVDLARSTR